jgi:hypothetical protein
MGGTSQQQQQQQQLQQVEGYGTYEGMNEAAFVGEGIVE